MDLNNVSEITETEVKDVTVTDIEPLLDARILRAIREMGFETLSPIQQARILSARHRRARERLQPSVFPLFKSVTRN
jgi:superfamily II DNA/RNA helicase